MSLPRAVLHRVATQAAKLPTTSGHTCLMLGKRCDIRYARTRRNSFVIGSYSLFGIGIALALSC